MLEQCYHNLYPFRIIAHKGTTFYSPFPDIDGSLVHRTPSVVEGDLLIFPSYLCHCFNPSDSDEERAVIAFNMK